MDEIREQLTKEGKQNNAKELDGKKYTATID